MSRIRLAGLALGLSVGAALWSVGIGPSRNTAIADQDQPERSQHPKKPAADKNKGPQGQGAKKRAAGAQGRRPGKPDVNRLSMELKALRMLRGLEATPEQISEIARMAKGMAATAEKREPGKAADDYIDTLTQLRDALVKNEEQKIETLQNKLDELQEKQPPDLDDEVDITDAAEIEVQRLLSLFSPQQVVAYADSLGDDLPDPVQLILDGIEEGRELKDAEWQTTRDQLAEKVSWFVCGLNGEKAPKVEEDVSKFLERTHSGKGQANDRKVEIRRLIGSPGPLVLLNNILEHDLATLLSNPQLERASKACLRHKGTQLASAENPVMKAAQKPKRNPPSAPPSPANAGTSNKSAKPGKPSQKAKVTDLDEVLKSPEAFLDRDLRFENVTITGIVHGKRENMLWLEVKTGSGEIVHAAMRGQKLTFVMPNGDAPQAITQMTSGQAVSATLICHLRDTGQGKHWNARVKRIELHEGK